MAANKFATMLHRSTNRITVVLVYTILEWVLIILLLYNSFVSYLISKFTTYFGLKSPCLWCSRVDHVFEPGKNRASYRDLVCETHASEISKLGYCTKHGKLLESQDMCEDCSSSRPDSHGKRFDIGRRIALFSLVKQRSLISCNGEKQQIENDDKSYRCSCCDVSLDSKFYSPCLLEKPSWGVLDYAQKANLIASAIVADWDHYKSDCSTDEYEMERIRGENGEELVYDEDQNPSDVHEGDHRREDCFQCREITGDEEEKMGTVGMTEQKPIEEVESNDLIQVCSRTDGSAEILHAHLQNPGYVDDHRVVPVELIDSMTAENQNIFRYRKEDQILLGSESLIDTQFKFISTQFEIILEKGNISEEAATVTSADKTIGSIKLESMDSVLHAEKRSDGDGSEAESGKESEDCPASEEAVSEMLGDVRSNILAMIEEPCNRPQAIEPVPSLSCLQQDQSSKDHYFTRNSNHSDTLMVEIDQGVTLGPKRAEDATMEYRNAHFDEEKEPETPTYIEGGYNLHQKMFLQLKKEFGAEESLDGSVIGEFECGDGVLTIENLKSALAAERKALNDMYAELEEERSSSAIAANQTMAMITRLQEEKSAMQMEALQYQRMMEEQSEYDQEALQLLNELMVKREKEKQELEKELEIYRKRALDYEGKEQRMMRRRKDSNGRSRTSSTYSSYAEDCDEVSIDLNHEVRDEDGFCSHKESSNSNHYSPDDVVLNLEDVGLECAKQHLSALNEADFEEERLSILEQLKALEEKLFTLDDDEGHFFEDRIPMEHIPEQNGKELNENSDFNHQETNGVANVFFDHLDVKHHQERRNMGAEGKRLLPLFDAIGTENEDGVLNGEQGESNGVLLQNSPASKFTLDNRTSVEEEVDHLYERLQALEADREFLKHCISSLKKGDKGMDLLQEILQHLRDLKSVELRARNMDDGALA